MSGRQAMPPDDRHSPLSFRRFAGDMQAGKSAPHRGRVALGQSSSQRSSGHRTTPGNVIRMEAF